MAKLAIVLILALSVHAAIAGHRKQRKGPGRGKHGGHKPEGGDFDPRKMGGKDMMEKMFVMRMRKMLLPMREFFTKVLAIGPEQTVPGRPKFCGDNECPRYKRVKAARRTDMYEKRCYGSDKWISIQMEGATSKAVSSKMFWPLFNYISGRGNARNETIKMTVPVTTTIVPTDKANTKSYNMSFYLPRAHQANPPSPTDPRVKVMTTSPTCYYVHSFGEWAWGERDFRMHAAMLVKALNRDGLRGTFLAPAEMLITAGYDDPMKMFNRHNEVWLMVKPSKEQRKGKKPN